MQQSLKYLSAQKGATSLHLTKADLSRQPLDVHDDLRKHLSKPQQIELWDGEYKEWWGNGQLRYHYWVKDGLKHGECKQWYDNGQLKEHCWYKDGKQDGEYKQWYDNGQIAAHIWYKDNKRDGEYSLWYKNGQLWEQCWL